MNDNNKRPGLPAGTVAPDLKTPRVAERLEELMFDESLARGGVASAPSASGQAQGAISGAVNVDRDRMTALLQSMQQECVDLGNAAEVPHCSESALCFRWSSGFDTTIVANTGGCNAAGHSGCACSCC